MSIKSIKNTQTQLKDVEKLLKLDPTNTELLPQNHKLLADAVKPTNKTGVWRGIYGKTDQKKTG